MTSPIFGSSRNRRNASAVTANPGGTWTPLAVSSARLAHFPPTRGMSSFLTSSSRTTMASGLRTWLGSCWYLWCDWCFDYDPGFHREFCSSDFARFLRGFDAIFGNVDDHDRLSVFDSGCSSCGFSESSPHSFLQPVGSGGGDHLVF